ncbi:hypothetical protein [Streptomyces sp. cmx-4-9]|uniref:hypothetical protein n=1 Tax=Streptomyces sp. cmx-4-9 TaxID=2790941 RepID=UPI0039808620
MSNNDQIPAGGTGPDDDEWNDFVRRWEEQQLPAQPAPAPAPESVPAPRSRRVWPLHLTLALVAAGAAFAILQYTGTPPASSPHTHAQTHTDTPTPTDTKAPTHDSASSKGADSNSQDNTDHHDSYSAAPAGPAGTRPMAPLADLFPARVEDPSGTTFTRLGSTVMKSCTEPGSVGPRLAAMIDDSAGCIGEQIALYKDDRNNQFNLAVFTMKDPQDTVTVMTELTMAFDDYQVAAQAPPPGSGLPALPADSGLVQAFTGHGRVMVVSMGQWSDGRTADFQQLVDRMKPLYDTVSRKAAAHEAAG